MVVGGALVSQIERTGAVTNVQASDLLIGLWFGALGSAYFMYGRKQGSPIPLVCGMLLIAEPYLLKGTAPQLLVGLGLAAFPFLRR